MVTPKVFCVAVTLVEDEKEKAHSGHREGSVQGCTGTNAFSAVETVTLQLRWIQSSLLGLGP